MAIVVSKIVIINFAYCALYSKLSMTHAKVKDVE